MIFNLIRSKEDKFIFMQIWYRWLFENSKDWNGELGSEVAYLLGAIMNDMVVEVTGKSQIVKVLKNSHVKENNMIWNYLKFTDN